MSASDRTPTPRFIIGTDNQCVNPLFIETYLVNPYVNPYDHWNKTGIMGHVDEQK